MWPPATSTNVTSLCNDSQVAVHREDIILDWIMVILPPVLTPIWQTLHCQSQPTNHAEEWHQVSKSHIWPQANRRTHSNRKPQMSSTGNMQEKGMWPTWRYHTRGSRCPKRDFTSFRQADRLDWQWCYGYFPWQLAEPTGFQEQGGRLCDGS